jgi:hypothetical protein
MARTIAAQLRPLPVFIRFQRPGIGEIDEERKIAGNIITILDLRIGGEP